MQGMVRITNSVIKFAETSTDLMGIFEEGSKNRHTASTSTYYRPASW